MTRARRRFGFTVAGLCLLSLLAGLAAAWLWWRSRQVDDRLSYHFRGGRYTLSSTGGQLVLFGPPAESPWEPIRREVADAVGRLRNDQLLWEEYWIPQSHSAIGMNGRVTPRPGTATATLSERFSAWEKQVALLAALEDPDRFAAADLLLSQRLNGYWDGGWWWRRVSPGSFLSPQAVIAGNAGELSAVVEVPGSPPKIRSEPGQSFVERRAKSTRNKSRPWSTAGTGGWTWIGGRSRTGD